MPIPLKYKPFKVYLIMSSDPGLLFGILLYTFHLQEARSRHASVVMDNKLWITGGNGDGDAYESTEFVLSNGKVEQGPDLPYKMFAHCMVKLMDGKVMLIGGYTKEKGWQKWQLPREDDRVLIYDPQKNTFKQSSKLNYRRFLHACAVFHSPKHGGRPIVMAAGGVADQSAEVLDYTRDSAKWEDSGK